MNKHLQIPPMFKRVMCITKKLLKTLRTIFSGLQMIEEPEKMFS